MMNSMAIRDLRNNPTMMVNFLEKDEAVFITKHGKPIGVTLPLNDDVLSVGTKKALATELYKNGLISLGKIAELLGIDKTEAMKLLNDLHIEWIESDKSVIEEEVAQWL